MRLRLLAEAQQEIYDAAAWYQSRQAGLVLCQDLILGLSATGSASANEADVGACRALAEPVAPEFLALTKH